MKVLHINSYFRDSNFYKNLYDNQINSGLSIDVYVPVSISHRAPESNLGEYTTISGNYNEYERFLYYIKHKKIYKDILQRYNLLEYSVIHAHSLFSNGNIALRLKKKYGIPYVVAVRNTDINLFFKYLFHLRKIGIQILKEANKIVFLSEPYKRFTIENYIPREEKKKIINKSVVIPNGIDEFWFENKGVAKKIQKQKDIKLLFIGNINKNKNILTTIKAINILLDKGYTINFTIVGRVSDRTVFNQLIKLPYVNYIDPKPKEELLNIYRENDIFVMPSIHETFGIVYSEAMSQGLPVIYTKGQGFDGQFIEGQVGYGVNCFEPQDIANKIVDAIANYTDISRSCINNVNKFKWEEITKSYLEVYNSIKV